MSRRGFSLVQLLVVLALLVILLGIAAPALVNARSAAAQARNLNNLKVIGIACHNYHGANNVLPPGCDANHFSTAAYLLPYLEQDRLFRSIDFKKSCMDEANEKARQTSVPLFVSAMDPLKAEAGATNIVFSAGSKPLLADNNGAFFLNSKMRIPRDFPDGTSNTLMTGGTLRGDPSAGPTDVQRRYLKLPEKVADQGLSDAEVARLWKEGKESAGDRGSRWIDGRFLQSTFTATRLPNSPDPDVSFGGLGGLSTLRSLSDRVNIGLVDGSARTLSTKVSKETWTYLADRADGNVLGPDFNN